VFAWHETRVLKVSVLRRSDMKGHEEIIKHLNTRLAEELTAINQYFVHSEMTENWRYQQLTDEIKKRSIVEMKHAEKLIERIIFLEGHPIVSHLNQINIGSSVPEIHKNDVSLEYSAVAGYNESIRVAGELKDDGTKQLLESILKDEEGHVDWLEAQFDQIEQTGVENYLTEQIYE
jgi:bacterioferritin